MRVSLATDLVSREGATTKDAKLLNAFVETEGKESSVFKRPAMNTAFATSSGQAQGGIANNSRVYMINGDVLKSYNSGGTLVDNITL